MIGSYVLWVFIVVLVLMLAAVVLDRHLKNRKVVVQGAGNSKIKKAITVEAGINANWA